ncbi:MAG TPA: DUF4126 domain-containing protein [Phycisphaerales bacterium]|nr:DUF4126 domain-containing protein [Phycisphaerales bacterium]
MTLPYNEVMETLVSICVGLGLAAACGFRVFLPLAVMSWAARAGMVTPAESFAWVASWPAVLAFSTACLAEVTGYYIPWVDNALDTAATPAAVVAGSLVAVSQFAHLDPLLAWTTGIIGGGGLAGAVQGLTVLTRASSTATTVGVANPVVSTAENGAAATVAVASILSPMAVGVLILLVAVMTVRWAWRRRPPRRLTPTRVMRPDPA